MSTTVLGQKTDTLTFYSKAFNSERSVYVTTPEFYKYQSKDVKLPVIYLLDGQHEWFVHPVMNSIRYLQYTHQVPQAIIVTIPLINRNKECGIKIPAEGDVPLYQFITDEVDSKIQLYQTSNYKILIGHSFSASFSLYCYLTNPTYFSAVLANTPLDNFRALIMAFEANEKIAKHSIFISVGGKAKHEDFYHRKAFDTLKKEFPVFFSSIHTFVAAHAGHNAVPILATPNLLTKLFSEFNQRYSGIAPVDHDYKITSRPHSITEEITKIESASRLGNHFYPPEIAEINGMASRYWNSDLNDYAAAVYEMGVKYYPDYYDFHLQLYELLLPADRERAKKHLNNAYELLHTVEGNQQTMHDIIEEINNEKMKNGW